MSAPTHIFVELVRGCDFLKPQQRSKLLELAGQLTPDGCDRIAREIVDSAKRQRDIYQREISRLSAIERRIKRDTDLIDIDQANVGNCWVAGGIAAAAGSDAFKHLVCTNVKEIERGKKYQVRLPMGKLDAPWTEITVDLINERQYVKANTEVKKRIVRGVEEEYLVVKNWEAISKADYKRIEKENRDRPAADRRLKNVPLRALRPIEAKTRDNSKDLFGYVLLAEAYTLKKFGRQGATGPINRLGSEGGFGDQALEEFIHGVRNNRISIYEPRGGAETTETRVNAEGQRLTRALLRNYSNGRDIVTLSSKHTASGSDADEYEIDYIDSTGRAGKRKIYYNHQYVYVGMATVNGTRYHDVRNPHSTNRADRILFTEDQLLAAFSRVEAVRVDFTAVLPAPPART